jgi:flavin reductase (DIM6/NTAB) family NADH-FMN oxidoreductase RutF
MPITGENYRDVGRSAAGAVSVVAAYAADEVGVAALTVSSFVTLSFEPPLVMFAIQHAGASFRPIVESRSFGVSLLMASQKHLAERFATRGSGQRDPRDFVPGETLRAPLIAEALAQVECSTHQLMVSGDHAIVVGLVEAARTRPGRPLLYFDRQYGSFAAL